MEPAVSAVGITRRPAEDGFTKYELRYSAVPVAIVLLPNGAATVEVERALWELADAIGAALAATNRPALLLI